MKEMMSTSAMFLLLFLVPLPSIRCDPMELSSLILREDTPIGHLLVTLNASASKQRNSYRFVSNNHRELQRYFSLNSSTGEIRLASEINREQLCKQRQMQCQFSLRVFELYHEKLYHIPIVLEDVNGHRPVFLHHSSHIEFHISENSPPYQSKLFIQQVYDKDQRQNQKQFRYQLKDYGKHFPFVLEINDDLATRLALLLIQSLDRESIDSYNCTLYVTSTDGHEEQLHIHIIIDDVNDQSPIFESDIYAIELSENLPINTTVIQLHAYDADSGLNARIIYDFPDASKQYKSLFSLNPQTGLLRLRSVLDYEQRTSYLFYIEARDSGKESRASQTLINITIIDENDCYPVINFRFLPDIHYDSGKDLIHISENYSIDKFFAQIFVTDQDSDLNGQVRLWFEGSDRSFNLYQIDNSTYFLNRTKPFDFEGQKQFDLKFYAQDLHPRKPLQTQKTLTIHVRDENDHVPRFLHPFYRLSLFENNPKGVIVTKIEAFDPDNGENGRITYTILTNETFLPFQIDSTSGILRCLQTLDRENRSEYRFEILARDHGSPSSLSSKIPVRIDVKDRNDNRPRFEHDKYQFSIEENFPRWKSFGFIRAFDSDANTYLSYQIQNQSKFGINQKGEIYLRETIDREKESDYSFFVTVSDYSFETTVPVRIQILDINDCVPQWIHPSVNQTRLFLNRDLIILGTKFLQLTATDSDEVSNGNGFVRYFIEEKYDFLELMNADELFCNSTPSIGHYLLKIEAKDNGKNIQHSSVIYIDLFIGDNQTNGSILLDSFAKINSLSTVKRVILLSTFFLSMAFILIFIICAILILICRYRKQKYLYYNECVKNQINHHAIDFNSNSSKLSLENLQKKSLVNQLSDTNIYIQRHIIKPTPTTSDYYSNSSKHEEDVDELTDEQQQRTALDTSTEWSIEKILYPDWLYKDIITTPRKHLNTSTFTDLDLDTNGSVLSHERRTVSGNHQLSPKQVRFGGQESIRPYPHLTTTIQKQRTGVKTTIPSENNAHKTFI